MDFRDLHCFVAVAEELHFTRAAERLGMAQPPLSQQIRRAEAELGLPLFVRSTRKVELTPAGIVFLARARDLLGRRDQAIIAARRAAAGESGDVRVGFAATSAVGLLPQIVSRFRECFPGIRLIIEECESDDLAPGLAGGKFDIVIARAPFRHKGLSVQSLFREPFMAALPRSHALCRLATVPLEMLSDQPFILFPRHTAAGLFDLIIKMCGDNGFSPDIVQEASSWSTVVTLVGAGIGVTVAPSSAQLLCPPSVAFRTLTGADGEAELVLAFSEDTASPAAMRFAEVALEAVRVK